MTAFRLLAAVGLFCRVPAFAADPPIAATNWFVDDATAWRPDDLQIILELATVLPDTLRQPGISVLFRRNTLGPRDDGAEALHRVARWRGRGLIDVDTGALDHSNADERAPTPSDAPVATLRGELLRRQLVHALVHVADHRASWSSDGAWRLLSEWPGHPFAGPGEREPDAFATPEGRTSTAEDFATSAEHYFRGQRLVADTPRYPGCRMRSKWTFLRDAFGSEPTPHEACASLAEVGFDPEQVTAIDLLYIQASMRTVASLAGHLAVAISIRSEDGPPTVTTYQLAADPAGADPKSPLYALRGLLGGFSSTVLSESYPRFLLRYARDNRSVQSLRLQLNDEEKRRFLERLDDARQTWTRRYIFTTRNCTYLPRTLIEWALGEKLRLPDLNGPDAVLGALVRLGRLSPLPATILDEFNLYDRARAADVLREADAEALRLAHPATAAEIDRYEALIERPSPKSRALAFDGFSSLGESAEGVSHPPYRTLSRVLAASEEIERLRLLRSRSTATTEALDALWGAQWALAAAEGQTGLPRSGDGGLRSDLLVSLNRAAETTGTIGGAQAHTALRRVDVEGGVRTEGASSFAVFSVASSVYGYQLGEARRFTLARGLDLQLFDSRFSVVIGTKPEMESRVRVVRARRILGHAPIANPGYYVSVLTLERRAGISSGVQLDLAEAGLLLELWQSDNHRHHLGVSTGIRASASTARLFGDPSDWALEAGVPLGLFARLGSRTDPMSGIGVEARWTKFPLDQDPREDGEGRATARLRIGPANGVDVALSATYDGRISTTRNIPIVHTVTLGTLLERF